MSYTEHSFRKKTPLEAEFFLILNSTKKFSKDFLQGVQNDITEEYSYQKFCLWQTHKSTLYNPQSSAAED